MQKDESPRPRIRHSTIARDMRVFRSLLKVFADEVEKEAMKRFKKGHWTESWKSITPENLLVQRREMVARVKQGMLERRDLEIEIALQAAIVWYLRLEDNKRARLLELW
jgi:hypothetical protein